MIYIFTGEEYQVESAHKRLIEEKLPSGRDFNLDLIEGKELTPAILSERCRSLPLKAATRVVVVRDADKISKGVLEDLLDSIEEIHRSAVLIFVAPKLDQRFKLWQKLKESAQWKEFRPPTTRDLPGWILSECRQRGIRIEPPAVSWLVERIGSEQRLILSSLEKVSLLVGRDRPIGPKDLEQAVDSFSWKSLFDLTDAIGRQEGGRAISLWNRIVSSGESPVGILALIARHFRILWKVKETGQGAPPYFLKNYQEQASRFSLKKIQNAIDTIFKTDWQLKSSPVSQGLLMDRLVWELCRQGSYRL
ncbi:MAG: DNA polymerase III subunit delta [Deltaproteobacteria bacterium]|nr:DNA polymerase III subunit delta [Deltaproteobacteria bacterium]